MTSLTLTLCALFLVASLGRVSSSAIRAAPYYMPLDNDPQNIDDIVANSGIRHFIFAFALASNDGQCIPTWDGNKGQTIADDTVVADMVRKVRSHGGDISISFGGYNGVELGHVCKSPQELAHAYQIVIDKYQLTHVDFDIENANLGAVDEEQRRFQAIKIMKDNAKAKGKELHITLTLPCTTVGLSELGRSEIGRGVAVQQDLVDLYKIMAFDYGGPGATQAESVQHVMEQVHTQIKALRSDLNDAQAWAHIGMILMNGHTDQPSELFSQDTFSKLVDFANQKKMGRVSYWALNRDRPCPSGKTLGWAAGICSSVAQQPWEFTKIIAKFQPGENTDPGHHTSAPHTDAPHTNAPHTEPNHHTSAPVTKAPVTQGPTQHIDCSDNHPHDQYYPYKGDCHKYIRCYGGQQHVETCAEGTIYDLGLHNCNWERDVNRPECK